MRCYLDGCVRQTRTTCFRCGQAACEDHRGFVGDQHICYECAGQTPERLDPEDDACPTCGADRMDGCDCHETLLGFPEHGCSD